MAGIPRTAHAGYMSTHSRTAPLASAGNRSATPVRSRSRLASGVSGPSATLLRKIGASLISILRSEALRDARFRERREHGLMELHRLGGDIRYF